MSPDKILTHSLFGIDSTVEDELEVQAALGDLLNDGWRLVRLHDTALLEADGRPVPTVTWAVAEEWTP